MRRTVIICSVLLFAASIAVAAETDTTNTYQEISGHYEAIRLALLEDSLSGVAGHAENIERSVARLLEDDLRADLVGVPEDKVDQSRELLPEIAAAAGRVAGAADLDAARAEFFELSKPLGRYRKLTGDLDTKVMFCPMAKKAWIQPEGETGNPYLGPDMPTCGQVVAD